MESQGRVTTEHTALSSYSYLVVCGPTWFLAILNLALGDLLVDKAAAHLSIARHVDVYQGSNSLFLKEYHLFELLYPSIDLIFTAIIFF